jgi:fructose-1,6-bisphosphatase I
VGLAGETNVQGEEQKKLDVLSNDIMVNALRASGKTAVLVSEELDKAIIIEERLRGKYCVVFDPLDGSSNIDAGVNIGTIFGIYQIVSNMETIRKRKASPTRSFSTETWIDRLDR